MQNQIKRKSIVIMFAIISFISGFLFLKNGSIIGNLIINRYQPISLLSMIGLLLIFCSIILAIYIIKKE